MEILPLSSRFLDTKKTTIDNKSTFNKWISPDVVDSNHNLRFNNYVVPNNRASRPDQISEDVYNTNVYWWVIVAYNAPRNTLLWPQAGETIKIPLLQDILKEL